MAQSISLSRHAQYRDWGRERNQRDSESQESCGHVKSPEAPRHTSAPKEASFARQAEIVRDGPESSCATSLHGTHDAPLGGGQGSTMLLAIGIAVATKHICHFQFRRFYGGWAGAAGR